VLKSTRPPTDFAPGWSPEERRTFTRCVRRSYRLELMAAGQPCLLWLSGRNRPGVHSLGVLAGAAQPDGDGWTVPLELTLLPDPIPRAELLADPVVREAEVLRMPAGSNPSWLSAAQFAAVLARAGHHGLGPWAA
jgi:hypothetical protein